MCSSSCTSSSLSAAPPARYTALTQEKKLAKQYAEVLARLKADRGKQPDAGALQSLETIQLKKAALKLTRLEQYNQLMNQSLADCLGLDLLLCALCLGFFFLNRVVAAQQVLLKQYLSFLAFYFENMMSGVVFLKLTFSIYSGYPAHLFRFRLLMIYAFIGVFTAGKVYEAFNLSAYHADQLQAVFAMLATILVYGLGLALSSSGFGRGLRRGLYAVMVGDLKRELESSK